MQLEPFDCAVSVGVEGFEDVVPGLTNAYHLLDAL